MTRSTKRGDSSDTTTSTSTIVWTNIKHGVVRKAVAYILWNAVGSKGTRCPLDYFVVPLNDLIGGVEVGGDAAPFTEEMIRRAFINNNPSSLADCVATIGTSFEGILHVRSGKQGTSRNAAIVHDIGLFQCMDSAILGCATADSDPKLARTMLRTVNLSNISDDIRLFLQQFAVKEKKRAGYAQSAKTNKEQARKRRKTEDGDDADEEEMKEINTLRLHVAEDKRRREKLMKQLEAANEDLERSTTALTKAVGSLCIDDDCVGLEYDYQYDKTTGKSSADNESTILRYYYGDAIGVLDLVGPPSD